MFRLSDEVIDLVNQNLASAPSERSDARSPTRGKGSGERGGSPFPRQQCSAPERASQRSVYVAPFFAFTSGFTAFPLRIDSPVISIRCAL